MRERKYGELKHAPAATANRRIACRLIARSVCIFLAVLAWASMMCAHTAACNEQILLMSLTGRRRLALRGGGGVAPPGAQHAGSLNDDLIKYPTNTAGRGGL